MEERTYSGMTLEEAKAIHAPRKTPLVISDLIARIEELEAVIKSGEKTNREQDEALGKLHDVVAAAKRHIERGHPADCNCRPHCHCSILYALRKLDKET